MFTVIGFIVLVVSIVAWIQIITKAGFSPYWILLPVSTFLLYVITWVAFFHFAFSGSRGSFGSGAEGGVLFLVAVDWILVVTNIVFFFIFAFIEWPIQREADARPSSSAPRRPSGGGLPGSFPGSSYPPGPPRSPAGWAPAPAPALAPASTIGAPAGVASPAQSSDGPEGWYTSGQIGSGEQSYWDGSAWTARRRWVNDTWVGLPPHGETQGGAGLGV